MKCPDCQNNHQKKYGMKCSCGYEFALDKSVYGMADGKLLALVRRASGNDTLYFTRNQLVTADAKIDKKTGYGCLVFGAMALIIGLVFVAQAGPSMIILMIIGVIGILASLSMLFFVKPDEAKIFRALDVFQSKKGKFKKLVEEPELNSPPPNEFEPDIYDYGVERILIVQRPILVDLLVKNKVHVQTRSLIMCSDGYPKYLEPNMDKLLSESPELPVFFLHDSKVSGRDWANVQMASQRFNNGRRKLVDMGFSPDDFKNLRRLDGLRLQKQNFEAAVDVIPMAMLVNGVIVSFDQEMPLGEIIAKNVAEDSSSSFG